MSANIPDICEAARDVLASAIGARVKYASMPNTAPAALPAAVVQYIATELTYANHNRRTAEGKQSATVEKRTHSGALYAILSITADIPAEARDIERAVQAVVDAFDADATLYRGSDTVARFRLIRPRAWREDVPNGGVYAGVTAEWEAIEL